jgi:hypothetical protein
MDTREGPATFSLPTGIAVELAPRTSLRVLLSDRHRYGVTLLRGMALFSVDPRQARTGFFVDTPAGTVRVTGTLFTVVVSGEGGVTISLHRGRVAWVSAGGESAVAEGELVSADGTGVSPLADGALNEAIAAQLQAVRCGDKRALFTELTGGCDSGPLHRETDGKAKRTGNSLGELMAQARRHRADGDWAGAAAVYRRVMEQYPASNEARTSMISLGQIQLRHLGDPAGALQQFSAYLKRPGPLAEEALYGRAGACRAMGDGNGEVTSLRRLQAEFPEGIYAGAAARRLSALQKESP